jgi:hypothetical protein
MLLFFTKEKKLAECHPEFLSSTTFLVADTFLVINLFSRQHISCRLLPRASETQLEEPEWRAIGLIAAIWSRTTKSRCSTMTHGEQRSPSPLNVPVLVLQKLEKKINTLCTFSSIVFRYGGFRG